MAKKVQNSLEFSWQMVILCLILTVMVLAVVATGQLQMLSSSASNRQAQTLNATKVRGPHLGFTLVGVSEKKTANISDKIFKNRILVREEGTSEIKGIVRRGY